MRHPRFSSVIAALALGAFGLAACSDSSTTLTGPTGSPGAGPSTTSSGSSTSPAPGGGTGTAPGGGGTVSSMGQVTVMMTDSPFQDASAVLVGISEVSVHRTGGGWEPLVLEGGAVTCDLKLLEGPMDLLGEALLEPGKYTQIRLTVDTARIYFGEAAGPAEADACVATAELVEPDDPSAEVTVPSGVVRLNRPFTVPEGGEAVILLDFDGDASIRKIGNPNADCELEEGGAVLAPTNNGRGGGAGSSETCVYRMNPVISVVSVEEIEGAGEPEPEEN